MSLLLDWPTGERQEQFAYSMVAVTLSVGTAFFVSQYVAFALAMAWMLWFVWLLYLQPMFFPPVAEATPQEAEAEAAAEWYKSLSVSDPTTIKLMQRELLVADRERAELRKRLDELEKKKE